MPTKNSESSSRDTQEESTLHRKARELLQDPELLDRAAELIGDLGLCGEDQNRRMVFLAGIGGLLGQPIHLIVKGASSGGKNTLVNKALSLLPDEEVRQITYMSQKWMSRAPSPLTGVLVIVEAEGQQSAEYTLRAAMSEGEVANYTLVPTDQGGWVQEEQQVEVVASVITTTTETSLHPENQTRVFDLWIDESEDQTRQVLRALADRAAGTQLGSDTEERREVWQAALGLLEQREVFVPYAPELAEAIQPGQLRMRRDFKRLLSLIKIVALLHQEQRLRLPDGAIIAELSDYEVGYRLLQEILGPSIQGLTSTALELCELHDELAASTRDGWVKRKNLEQEAGKRDIASPNTVHEWSKQLTQLGYWQGDVRGRFGAWYHRQIRDPSEEPVALPRPEDLDRPDLPRGPNSRIGSRSLSDHGAFEPPPSAPSQEGACDGRSEAPGTPSSSHSDCWEASDNPHHEGEKSSQPASGRGLDPDEAEDGDGEVVIPSYLVDGRRWK